jgi:hypothetical protein
MADADASWSPPDADFKDADWSPPAADFNPANTTQEASDGAQGFINGIAGTIGKGVLNVPYAAAHGVQDLYRRVTGANPDAPDSGIVNALHVPLNENEKNVSSSIANSPMIADAKNAVSRVASEDFPLPASETDFLKSYVAPVATDVASIVPAVSGGRGAASRLSDLPSIPPIKTPLSAEEAVAQNAAAHSTGAAGSVPDLSVAPPELKAAISQAAQTTGGSIHPVALDRHLDTAQLPLPEGTSPLQLRKGQATGDTQQISDEKNLRADPDTQGILSDSINDQDSKLGASMGEIRRQATPDIVQRNNAEHGQAAIDAIKNQDNNTVTDIRAKYQALADANGGDMPIDAGSTLNNINARLKKGSLRNTARDNGVISEVMDNLQSGEPMDFETFENSRSRLAEVQRGGGSDGVAAGIVHDELNNMPLTPEAAPLRDMADTARQAAKARFDTIKLNPAYDAAINDNVPKVKGLHVVGAPSPLAESFMDRYALGNGENASSAYVQRLKEAVPDPVISQSMEAAALNKLQSAAGIDSFGNGSFRNASYGNAVNAMAPKATALLSPQSIENTQRLKRVSGYVNNESKASSTNRSNTMLALQRFGAVGTEIPSPAAALVRHGLDTAGDITAAHVAGPLGVGVKRAGQGIFKSSKDAKALQAMKDAKLKFALDATKPGAGLDYVPPAPTTRIQRASGGKVDDVETLVNKLMERWKKAKKATDATTKPLLRVPDAAIVRALDIAGRAI